MGKREFLQLAHTYSGKKHGIAGWYMSEKLDGMRCLWDGGFTRGMLCSNVPFANVEKHNRFVVKPVATGLWTRYGQPIHAPAAFLDRLPPVILDGELYAGRNMFQHVVSACKKHEPIDSEWDRISYQVFDVPRSDEVFADGVINNINFKKIFKGIDVPVFDQPSSNCGFASRIKWVETVKARWGLKGAWNIHKQHQLPFSSAEAVAAMEAFLDEVLSKGGEGLILKSPNCLWLPERCHTMLKYKPYLDAEGTVIGYTWGKETDKGSKLLGLMGNLILMQDNGMRLELSGFTNEERKMTFLDGYHYDGTPGNVAGGQDASGQGSLHPGEPVAKHIHNPKFPLRSRITYKYRELTDDGVAKEARYWRKA